MTSEKKDRIGEGSYGQTGDIRHPDQSEATYDRYLSAVCADVINGAVQNHVAVDELTGEETWFKQIVNRHKDDHDIAIPLQDLLTKIKQTLTP